MTTAPYFGTTQALKIASRWLAVSQKCPITPLLGIHSTRANLKPTALLQKNHWWGGEYFTWPQTGPLRLLPPPGPFWPDRLSCCFSNQPRNKAGPHNPIPSQAKVSSEGLPSSMGPPWSEAQKPGALQALVLPADTAKPCCSNASHPIALPSGKEKKW